MKIKKYELILVGSIVGLDVITKTIISTVFEYGERFEVIKDFFWLTYLRNFGAAWSILEGQKWFFILVGLVAMVGMIYYYSKSDDKQIIFRISLMLLFAGTLGNFMDRALLGYVRDFLSFKIIDYYFPVFNIADISLNVGVGFLILDSILESRRENGKL
jgi:signal peptidase II